MTSGGASRDSTEWKRVLWRLALGGTLLALVEIVTTLAVGRRFFLSSAEVLRYVAVAWSALSAGVLVAGTALHRFDRFVDVLADEQARARRLVRWTVGACVPAFGVLGWSLTAGRRVRALPVRVPVVLVFVLAATALVAWGVRVLHRRRQRVGSDVPLIGAAASIALVALVINALVLRRLYPTFHIALAAVSVGLVSRGALWWSEWAWSRERPPSRALEWLGVLWALLVFVSLPVFSDRLARASNGRVAVVQAAAISGQWIAAWGAWTASERASDVTSQGVEVPTEELDHDRAGLNLRGQDILLITIDALRADRLAAYGGHGLTPNMDRLAQESVVFARAYTPTPHTSYALASLLTGKFMRPVLDLPNVSSDHRTLPEVLRRYGYRTAAFFPPAVFFVDADRFASLSANDFGFEYRKVMFASAQDRAKQVKKYLAQSEAGHPVFVWVHLFEPHEPYAPKPPFVRGDSAQERYDGEVAQADDGVGQIVNVFRAARPKSTVIVSADHGEEFGDHGGNFHGTTLFDEQVRVPLLWSSPGIKPRVSALPVETVDVATTLLAGLGIPRDARMRGDDLGPALRGGDDQNGPRHAFADIGDSRMVTDGVHKLICHSDSGECLLFDLTADALETRDLVDSKPAVVEALRAALGAFVGSIPSVEAVALGDGVGWPQQLARARLGDRSVGPELVPLLGADQPLWRAEAARACGELRYSPALQVVDQLRVHDPDRRVRAEAALATLALGERLALQDVVSVAVAPESERELRLRAALLLARNGDPSGVQTLIETAKDANLSERERVPAVDALGALRASSATAALVELLEDVRLRPNAATALGLIGGRTARRALLAALETERYPLAREAQARALVELREPKVRPLIERFLGTDTSLPSGVRLLIRLGALSLPSPRGARLTDVAAWCGGFVCDSDGCAPQRDGVPSSELAQGSIRLPAQALRGASRVIFALDVEQPQSRVLIGTETIGVAPGLRQVSIPLSAAPGAFVLPVAATAGVRFIAFVVVPQTPDIGPPVVVAPAVAPGSPTSAPGQ